MRNNRRKGLKIKSYQPLLWLMAGMSPFCLADNIKDHPAGSAFVFPSQGTGLAATLQSSTHLSTAHPMPFAQIEGVNYANNARVSTIQVKVARNNIPADGQSMVSLAMTFLDEKNQPLIGDAIATIEVTGGRLHIPGASTDEFGPDRKDLDQIQKGVQLKVENGQAKIDLIAPFEAQDVKVRVTAGRAQAQGTISFLPDLRDMLAVGLIEGIIRFDSKSLLELGRARSDDGFEKEIRHFEVPPKVGHFYQP